MAAVLILGLTLGAAKIQEKREEKKAKKAALEWENAHNAQITGVTERGRTTQAKGKRRGRRENEQERESSVDAEGRRSESLEREDSVPPPKYEDVIGMRGADALR